MKPTWPVMAWVSTDSAVGSLPCRDQGWRFRTVLDQQQPPPSPLQIVWTHDLYGSDAAHQLLQQCDVAVGELADALSDELLLVDGEAVGVPTLQQTERHEKNTGENILVTRDILDSFHLRGPNTACQGYDCAQI